MHKYKYNTCLMGEGVQDFMQMLSLLLQLFLSSRLLDLADFASKFLRRKSKPFSLLLAKYFYEADRL